MTATRQKKTEAIEKLRTIFARAISVVFVNFRGLTVADATKLRSGLRGKNVGYIVAKKTLARIALGEAPFKGNVPELPGELAIAWGDDPLAPAREVHAFAAKREGLLQIMGGVYEGSYVGASEMRELATIPPEDTLRGMFLNLINSPIHRFVVALDRIAAKKN